MQREIAEHPEIGCLHVENYGALRPISVQYWRSVADLERFARSSRWSHLPAWQSFNRLIRDTWRAGRLAHETYRVRAGERERCTATCP
ncbi:MAG TPA: DUF4188 domain-containing protein [Euzebyales bacterium]|nr:DUF4188 domain-containing protein [Euzebyales bacterium]